MKGRYHVNVILLFEKFDLRLGQASKTEHANLIGDMLPLARGTLGLETLAKTLTHVDDTTTHRAQILLPHGEQLRVVEDTTGNVRPVGRGVGDLCPLQGRQLRGDVRGGCDSVGTGRSDEMKGPRTLTIQSKVLRKRLRNAQLEALVDKVADGPRVTDQIARGKALVGAVEEGEVVALAHHLGNLLPLLLGGIDAGRVVSAGMEQHDGASGCGAQTGKHAIDIKPLGLGMEVRVLSQ